jgi:hypothetical protein
MAVAVLALTAATADAAVPAHGRVWELVTPPNPGGSMFGSVYATVATGDRLGYTTISALPGAQASSWTTLSLASRGPSGWTSAPNMPPYSVGALTFIPPTPVAADEDLSTWVWGSRFPFVPGGPADPNTGLYSSGVGVTPMLLADAGPTEVVVPGASADARRIVFQTQSALLPGDVRTSGRQVYELTDAGLRLAGVDSGGVPLSTCGAVTEIGRFAPNAVSRDGRRIFITSPDASCGASTRRVYLREDGATTTEISASHCTRAGCNAPAEVKFMGATPSGSVAFVATSQQLTDDDVDTGEDLYRYDVAAGTLSRVSVGPPGVVASVAGVAFPSDDGSRVYFAANGRLVPGKGVAGAPNLYLSDDQGIRFVATLSTSDVAASGAFTVPARQEVQLTPDGARLLFKTTLALTSDDTDLRSDVYLYDADDGKLVRVSGIGSRGNSSLDADIAQSPPPAFLPTPAIAGHTPRSLSDDGRHVFFRTVEALTPDDVNGTTDVYEWFDGDLGLVTSGAPSGSVRYDAASADGSSVFFTTDESLTPDDDDQGDPDLYVAREGGGFPAAPPPAGCVGDGCVPPPYARLSRPVPESVDFAEDSPRGFGILRVSTAARRRMAASGWLTLRVASARPGRIVARARARVGGRTRIVAAGAVSAGRAGTVRLRLRLSPAARRRLDGGHALVVRVVVRGSKPDRVSRALLRLEPPR